MTVTGGHVHLSPSERAERGKAARREAPRRGVADWEPASDRLDPVDLLEAQAESRVQELLPIRYGRMLASPFTFFRGAAGIMAADLAPAPTSGLPVQACGDAHLSNFGLFASPERSLVFDLNDFDETHPGPWEWDLKRLTASLAIAGRHNGFSRKDRVRVVAQAARGYRKTMTELAGKSNLDVWYARTSVESGLPRVRDMVAEKDVAQIEKVVKKAMTKDSAQAAARLTHVVDGRRQFVDDPPLVVPIEQLLPGDEGVAFRASMHDLVDGYRQTLSPERRQLLEGFRFQDLARKVVGVGSVGTRAWIILMTGRDDRDILLLQAKEAQPSVLEPFTKPCHFTNQGQRVVEGQRLMQASSDIFLGWHHTTGIDGQPRDFYVRQLRDWKGSLDPETMNPGVMTAYAHLCGWILARAHARSGDRIAIASYLGSSNHVDQAIVEFSETYADQNERDYAALQEAARTGRVPVEPGI